HGGPRLRGTHRTRAPDGIRAGAEPSDRTPDGRVGGLSCPTPTLSPRRTVTGSDRSRSPNSARVAPTTWTTFPSATAATRSGVSHRGAVTGPGRDGTAPH